MKRTKERGGGDEAGWIPRLNLRHLQLLVGLADLGSISDTARAMSTTQPALSKWLKELEEAIRAPLFERHTRGLAPTGHGLILLGHARRVLNEMERARLNLATLHGSSSCRVLLGTAPVSVTDLVPAAISAFLALHPMARVELREHTMSVLLDRLEKGELDVAVGSLDDYRPTPGLNSEVLYDEPMAVIARSGHPLAGAARLGWDDLLACDWILWPRGTVNRDRLDGALARAGRGPLPCRLESSSMLSNVTLLQKGDLLCAVSSRLARYFARRLQVTVLDFELGIENPIGMCWRDEPLQQAPTADVLECLRRAAAEGGLSEAERAEAAAVS